MLICTRNCSSRDNLRLFRAAKLCRETCVKISTGNSTLHTGKHPYIEKYFIMHAVAVFFVRDEIFPIVLKQLR